MSNNVIANEMHTRAHSRSSTLKKVSCLLFVGCLATGLSSRAQGIHPNNSCAGLSPAKNTILLDQSGKQVEHLSYDAGTVPLSSLRADFIYSKIKYRLVLFAKTRTLEDDCSMSTCVEAKKVLSICAGTNEYLLSIGLNPHKFGPGVFSSEFRLKINDDGWVEEQNKGFSFREIIEGSFSMPWLSPGVPQKAPVPVQALFDSEPATIEVPIKNTGTAPYKFGEWSAGGDEDSYYLLLPGSCKNAVLTPNGTCSIFIKKTHSGNPNGGALTWWNKFDGEDVSISLEFQKSNSAKADYHIENLR